MTKLVLNPECQFKRFNYLIAICFVTLFALFLRLHNLDHESLFMDELRQVSYYGNDFREIVRNAASQQQPPLDYWIGHLVFKISDSDYVA